MTGKLNTRLARRTASRLEYESRPRTRFHLPDIEWRMTGKSGKHSLIYQRVHHPIESSETTRFRMRHQRQPASPKRAHAQIQPRMSVSLNKTANLWFRIGRIDLAPYIKRLNAGAGRQGAATHRRIEAAASRHFALFVEAKLGVTNNCFN